MVQQTPDASLSRTPSPLRILLPLLCHQLRLLGGRTVGRDSMAENVPNPRDHLFAKEAHRALNHVVGIAPSLKIIANPIRSSRLASRRMVSATLSGPPKITMSFATI